MKNSKGSSIVIVLVFTLVLMMLSVSALTASGAAIAAGNRRPDDEQLTLFARNFHAAVFDYLNSGDDTTPDSLSVLIINAVYAKHDPKPEDSSGNCEIGVAPTNIDIPEDIGVDVISYGIKGEAFAATSYSYELIDPSDESLGYEPKRQSTQISGRFVFTLKAEYRGNITTTSATYDLKGVWYKIDDSGSIVFSNAGKWSFVSYEKS